MHYQAIQISTRSREPTVQCKLDQTQQEDLEVNVGSPPRVVNGTKKESPYGHDDAADSRTIARMSELQIISEMSSFNTSMKTDSASEQEDNPSHRYLAVPISTSSTGLTTFAYQRALKNRIEASKLLKDGSYDLTKYTLIFVHDTLMLLGSLSSLLSKGSSTDLLNRMTPALLPGHHAHINTETLQPYLARSAKPQAYVQGMLVFGQGKMSRDAVHQHFRPDSKRRKVGVEVDVWVETPPDEHKSATSVWRLERRTIQAHAWIWSGGLEDYKGGKYREWTIEDYLAGTLEEEMSMRFELDGKGDKEHHEWLGEDGSSVASKGEADGKDGVKHEGPSYKTFERDTWLD